MKHAQLRPSGRVDDLLCSLALPLALVTASPGPGAASVATLAVLSTLICAANYSCFSPLVLLGSQSVYLIAHVFHQSPGQLARLLLLAVLLLLMSHALLTRGGGSFSGGEALLVAQAVALLCVAAANALPALLVFGAPIQVSDRAALLHLLQTAGCWLLVLLALLTYVPAARSPVRLHLLLVLLAAGVVATTSAVIGTSCLLWIPAFLFRTRQRLRLLSWWSSLLAGAVLFAAVWSGSGGRSQTPATLRKTFHLLSCGVFVPGLLYDPELLLAASAGLAFVFVVAEVARVCEMEPWSGIMKAWFQPFLDSKDSGPLVLSNIYLVVSLAGPLWFQASAASPRGMDQDICLFAGVLTVGIGDTVAAAVGSWFGRCHWPGTRKTVEGSATSAAAQLLTCYIMHNAGYLVIGTTVLRRLCAAIAAATLAEAFTAQADNLLLPPVFVAVFRLSSLWL